jgi:hypothetical protein
LLLLFPSRLSFEFVKFCLTCLESNSRPPYSGRISNHRSYHHSVYPIYHLWFQSASFPKCASARPEGFHSHSQGLSQQCNSYVPTFQHSTDPSAYCGLNTMPFSSLCQMIYRKLLLCQIIPKGNILVFNSIFYACYHIMKCGFSGFTFLVSTLVSVKRMYRQYSIPNMPIH